jgi:hypothetical protein
LAADATAGYSPSRAQQKICVANYLHAAAVAIHGSGLLAIDRTLRNSKISFKTRCRQFAAAQDISFQFLNIITQGKQR